jgi:hypothetical protein
MGLYIKIIFPCALTLAIATSTLGAEGVDTRADFIDASKYFLHGEYNKALGKIALILDEEPDNIAALAT